MGRIQSPSLPSSDLVPSTAMWPLVTQGPLGVTFHDWNQLITDILQPSPTFSAPCLKYWLMIGPFVRTSENVPISVQIDQASTSKQLFSHCVHCYGVTKSWSLRHSVNGWIWIYEHCSGFLNSNFQKEMSQLPVSVSHLNGVYHDSGERMLQLKLDRFHQEEDQKGWQNRNVTAASMCCSFFFLRTKEDPVTSDAGTHFDFCWRLRRTLTSYMWCSALLCSTVALITFALEILLFSVFGLTRTLLFHRLVFLVS